MPERGYSQDSTNGGIERVDHDPAARDHKGSSPRWCSQQAPTDSEGPRHPAIHSLRTTGWSDDVRPTRQESAGEGACSPRPAAWCSTPERAGHVANQSIKACDASGPQTRTRESGRAAANTSRWLRACTLTDQAEARRRRPRPCAAPSTPPTTHPEKSDVARVRAWRARTGRHVRSTTPRWADTASRSWTTLTSFAPRAAAGKSAGVTPRLCRRRAGRERRLRARLRSRAPAAPRAVRAAAREFRRRALAASREGAELI